MSYSMTNRSTRGKHLMGRRNDKHRDASCSGILEEHADVLVGVVPDVVGAAADRFETGCPELAGSLVQFFSGDNA